jgi:hypothetical protein
MNASADLPGIHLLCIAPFTMLARQNSDRSRLLRHRRKAQELEGILQDCRGFWSNEGRYLSGRSV